MSNIHSDNSDYVVFSLKSDYGRTLKLRQEPDGWNDDDIKLSRHKDYHGIVTSYTQTLTFYKEAIDYINTAYELGGINANLYLIKEVLKDTGEDVKFVQEYSLLADFKTKREVNNGLEIRFNSNELEEIIKSHETDTFEIERLLSIDNEPIDELSLFSLPLSGRTIAGVGESRLNTNFNTYVSNNGIKEEKYQWTYIKNNEYTTAVTTMISEGSDRHASVDLIDGGGTKADDASKMFFIDSIAEGTTTSMRINYDYNLYVSAPFPFTLKSYFRIVQWNGLSYDTVLLDEIGSITVGASNVMTHITKSGYKEYTLEYNQGIMLCHIGDFSELEAFMSGQREGIYALFRMQNMTINFYEFYENSPNLNFIFLHDCIERLMYIITGQKGLFYSKYFGRTELGYVEDGEAGLIGLMSGLWARAFDRNSEKYKSMQISLKDVITSVQAVFNVGVTVENYKLTKRLRFEPLDYFYRDRAVIKLPYQVSNVDRKIDKDLFFSGTEIGFEHSGNYDNQVGLDEPNIRTETVTPIRKSTEKYRRVSKIRGDDTGLELARRKPQLLYPETDMSSDSHTWFLDLKREGSGYLQNTWEDRLQEPPTGINAPEDFKGMLFTPLRMLLRHGLILRAGLEPYYDKFIMYANSIANKNLSMLFKGETTQYRENSNILINDLERSKFTPDIIEFEHPVDDSLMELIMGTTKTMVNGTYEDVPNIYFPIEFINEKGERELGYFLDLEKSSGKFKFQKLNENSIKAI